MLSMHFKTDCVRDRMPDAMSRSDTVDTLMEFVVLCLPGCSDRDRVSKWHYGNFMGHSLEPIWDHACISLN